MTREELIATLKSLLWENDETKIIVFINSAIAYINGYTFQNYSLNDLSSIPTDIFMVIIELVKDKYHERVWVESERLSDYSITYTTKDLSNDAKILLDRYRIIYVN
jgi:hypothetical protein